MICLVFLFSIVRFDVFKIPLSNYSPQLFMDNCLKFLLAGLKEWKGFSQRFQSVLLYFLFTCSLLYFETIGVILFIYFP